MLHRLINGISQRQYEQVALRVPEIFGIKKSSVSRHFVRTTARRLETFLNRDVSQKGIVAIFMDGKRLAEIDMILVMGITMRGEKILLGFVETNTESRRVIQEVLRRLLERGLCFDQEILFIINGAKGLHKEIKSVSADIHRVNYWRHSDQRQRWTATALM